MGYDTEIIWFVVTKSGKVGCPCPRNSSTTNDILKQDVASSNEGHEVA
jgi:hypothetical protein